MFGVDVKKLRDLKQEKTESKEAVQKSDLLSDSHTILGGTTVKIKDSNIVDIYEEVTKRSVATATAKLNDTDPLKKISIKLRESVIQKVLSERGRGYGTKITSIIRIKDSYEDHIKNQTVPLKELIAKLNSKLDQYINNTRSEKTEDEIYQLANNINLMSSLLKINELEDELKNFLTDKEISSIYLAKRLSKSRD